MTEPIMPNPEANGDGPAEPFDFAALTAETEIPPQPTYAPNPKANKRRWWQGKPKSESKGASKPRKAPAPMPRGGLRKPLEDLYTALGMFMMPFDPSCAQIVIENASTCAESLDELAKTNPAVRRILISLVTTSAMGKVIMAHAPIIMAISMHHIPALRDKQGQMVADMAEAFANMPQEGDDEK